MESFEKSGLALKNVVLLSDFSNDRLQVKKLLNNGKCFVIFPHEWHKRSKQIISHINSYDNPNAKIFYARKCTVKEIELKTIRQFCDLYHIQGANHLGIKGWGIYYDDCLLGILSLGKHSRNEKDIVLDRLCFMDNIRVIGGASKLFSQTLRWAMEQGIKEISSFSDNRLSIGSLYQKLGFKLIKELPPDYFYLSKEDNFKYHSKQSQKKSNVNCPEDMTEKEWANTRGLFQVFDGGKKKWLYKIREEKKPKNPLVSRRNGYYETKKAGIIYYASSYELRAAVLLDEMEEVISYTNQVIFYFKGKKRYIDFLVKKNNGTYSIIEVKPQSRIEDCKEQINDNQAYAKQQSWDFSIWTEKELGFTSEYYFKVWADEFLTKIKSIDFVAERLKRSCARTKKHYYAKIAPDTINIWCDYCKTLHQPLRLTAEPNMEKNGIYICEPRGGFISGSKPKPHLHKINPYAAEGKKQCMGECKQILSFECFGVDKAKRDGHAAVCKACRREKANKKYHEKKHD